MSSDPKAKIPHAKLTPELRQAEADQERAQWEQGKRRKAEELGKAFAEEAAKRAEQGGNRGKQ
jgi:hypothetical protein